MAPNESQVLVAFGAGFLPQLQGILAPRLVLFYFEQLRPQWTKGAMRWRFVDKQKSGEDGGH